MIPVLLVFFTGGTTGTTLGVGQRAGVGRRPFFLFRVGQEPAEGRILKDLQLGRAEFRPLTNSKHELDRTELGS